ncbi:hypothetical protein V6E04_23955, partial [Serratia marcescens]|uniref:hypothetical protein n=1 Tax=Serratia marcescens TaxID=615 RepID=UPI002FDB1E8B
KIKHAIQQAICAFFDYSCLCLASFIPRLLFIGIAGDTLIRIILSIRKPSHASAHCALLIQP